MATRKAKSKKKKETSLTRALSFLLNKTLLPDLQERSKIPSVRTALNRQYATEISKKQTADTVDAWINRALEQVAAAWVLSCVFVRTLEDRELLPRRRIAGPGALDSDQQFFDLAPSLTTRDYLLTVFREVSTLPGAEQLLGPRYNPAWRLSPSNHGAVDLLDFFRQADAQGNLKWQFASLSSQSAENTRFLGDLYQDLSEGVRKRYALLQTPSFIESFILDQTLEPAIESFGLENVRLIDPACGSGHFLLGAFNRLVDHRLRSAPAIDIREHALKALDQLYGVDINPYAVAIARFRLTLAFLQKAGITKLAASPNLKLNLVVADSLLHGAKHTTKLLFDQPEADTDRKVWYPELFALDDPAGARRVFDQKYHAVVGNPPYITCKDSALRDQYREFYKKSASGKFALAAPFTERFFQLGVDGAFVGMITANSFMKREFGKALIEKVLPHVNLTRVIDTSGAYIPGHGTPTVLLFGRNQKPMTDKVPVVMGKRGEPTTPEIPDKGAVWSSIADHFADQGFENDYVSVASLPRDTLSKHPWSLGGGGAAELKELLEERAEKRLGDIVEDIGFASFPGLDEVFIVPPHLPDSAGIPSDLIRPMVIGESIRDWAATPDEVAITPYDLKTQEGVKYDPSARWAEFLWPFRTSLENVSSFGGKSRKQEGQDWWQWYRWQVERYKSPYRIVYAFVATHNHFVLDRGGKVFKQSAPIIKLPEGATEDDHLALLAYLNSSTACFWMKQVFYPKASATGDVSLEKGKPEANRYEFAGTGLLPLPIPAISAEQREYLISAARESLTLSEKLGSLSPSQIVKQISSNNSSPYSIIEKALAQKEAFKRRLAVLQEDIDWAVYKAFDIVESFVPTSDDLSLDDRPFLCASIITVSESWENRRKTISKSNELKLIENTVFKRPWLGSQGVFGHKTKSFEDQVRDAAKEWLQENVERAFRCDIESARGIARDVAQDEAIARVCHFMDPGSDAVDTITNIIGDGDLVSSVASAVFTDSGLRKHTMWRITWDLQRREDAGENVGNIPVPPKYVPKDYREPHFWRLRGKLDVPKERFISYPGCEKDGDPSPIIGWAGWNHLQRAKALVGLYQERKKEDGWDAERLKPMLVGLYELMPWLKQWHSQPEEGSDNPAREFELFLEGELRSWRITKDDLDAWSPSKKAKSGKAAKKSKINKVAKEANAEGEE